MEESGQSPQDADAGILADRQDDWREQNVEDRGHHLRNKNESEVRSGLNLLTRKRLER